MRMWPNFVCWVLISGWTWLVISGCKDMAPMLSWLEEFWETVDVRSFLWKKIFGQLKLHSFFSIKKEYKTIFSDLGNLIMLYEEATNLIPIIFKMKCSCNRIWKFWNIFFVQSKCSVQHSILCFLGIHAVLINGTQL